MHSVSANAQVALATDVTCERFNDTFGDGVSECLRNVHFVNPPVAVTIFGLLLGAAVVHDHQGVSGSQWGGT